MEERTILRLASMAAAVLIVGIAAATAKASMNSSRRDWWTPLLGLILAGAMVAAALTIAGKTYYVGFGE